MGAISSIESIPILKKYANDPNRSVRETVEIALAKIEWDHTEEGQKARKQLEDAENQYVCPLPYELCPYSPHFLGCTLPLTLHHQRPASSPLSLRPPMFPKSQ